MTKLSGESIRKLYLACISEEPSTKSRQLKSGEEWIKFALNVMLKHNVIPEEHGDVKDAERSEKLRQDGNRLYFSVKSPFTEDNCVEVIKLFTKSIAYAPSQSEQLALAYANRSAILIKLQKYKLCIQDIDKASALTSSDNVRAKLCIRKVECLKALKDPKAEDSIDGALALLEQLGLDDSFRKKVIEELDSSRMAGDVSKRNDPVEQPLPEISKPNLEVPCASDAVGIRYNYKHGRHVVATRYIDQGEVISIEEPYSMILIFEKLYSNCSNCLEVSWASIPCDYCTSAVYCSEDCRTAHWKKCHDVECAVFPCLYKMNLKFVDINLLSIRLAVQAVREFASIGELRKEVSEVDNYKDPRTKGFSKSGVLAGDKYRAILGLATNTDKRSKQQLFSRALESSFILYYLATRTNLFGEPLEKDLSILANNNDAVFIGSLILRHQQLIRINSGVFFEERELGDSVGCSLGIMPFLNLTNHSCNPNVLKMYKSNHLILFAMCPIERGEQIFDSYCPSYVSMPKSERQMILLKQYHFKCNCLPCQENWPIGFNKNRSKAMKY